MKTLQLNSITNFKFQTMKTMKTMKTMFNVCFTSNRNDRL